MNTKTLKDLFLEELADMYDAEKRIVKALPKLAKAATCTDLKGAIEKHLQETQGHVTKLEQVFQCFDLEAKGKTCEASKGLLEEGDQIAADFKGSPAINAAIICAAQKVEHYEMASYGCLHEWAGLLGNKKATRLLEDILNEETAANDSLTKLAVAKSNQDALCEFCDSEKDQDKVQQRENATDKRTEVPRRSVRPMMSASTR